MRRNAVFRGFLLFVATSELVNMILDHLSHQTTTSRIDGLYAIAALLMYMADRRAGRIQDLRRRIETLESERSREAP